MRKVCSICGQELPLDMFPINRGMKDGHLGKCFKCFEQFTSDRMRVINVYDRKDRGHTVVEPKKKKSRRKMTEAELVEKRKREQALKAVERLEVQVVKPLSGWSLKTPEEEKRERARAYSRAYYYRMKERDPERLKRRQRARRENASEEDRLKAQERTQDWKASHRDVVREQERQRYAKMKAEDPERYRRTLERKKRWRDENKEKMRAAHMRWREKNREHYRAYLKRWREENKEKVVAMQIRSLEKKLTQLKNSQKTLVD